MKHILLTLRCFHVTVCFKFVCSGLETGHRGGRQELLGEENYYRHSSYLTVLNTLY